MEKYISSDTDELNKHPGMTSWFCPSLLMDVGREAIIATIFGKYADRRLIRATLNSTNNDEAKACDFSNKMISDDETLWVDYVADVGDGFNSTYSVAYLLGQKQLELDQDTILPRGNLLIMGGDEVYPRATHNDYKWRMELPYSYAFPDKNEEGMKHPPVFLLPGNHDWYDGLTLFLAKFCRGPGEGNNPHKLKNSSWRLHQYRSYFAVKLPQNWWIFGIDTQLTADIDQPQYDYFFNIMKSVSSDEKHKIIICCSEPTWLTGHIKDDAGRSSYSTGVHYFTELLVKACWPEAKIYAVISGDSHHYNRYSTNDGTQFITAGGGGAFLHPTHHLEDKFLLDWSGKQDVRFNLEMSYPSRELSKSMALKNWMFPYRNMEFCLLLGCVYSIISLLLIGSVKHLSLVMAGDISLKVIINNFITLLFSPMGSIITVVFIYLFYKYDSKDALNKKGNWVGGLHGLLQMLILLMLVNILPLVFGEQSRFLCSITQVEWCPFSFSLFMFIPAMTFFGGLFGGCLFGIYLIAASWFYKRQRNDSFAAMQLDTYKNFLRMKIEGDTLTIYPFGIDEPARNWTANTTVPHGAKYVPSKELKYHLIEDAIVIKK